MAAAKKTRGKRTLKKAETVRQRVEKANQPAKTRRVKQAQSGAMKPLRAIGNRIVQGFRPLRFILRPFKTRPLRLIGKILSKILLFSYFRGSWQELRKVTWPSRRQTVQLTFAVFAFAIFFASVIALADYVIVKVFKALILK